MKVLTSTLLSVARVSERASMPAGSSMLMLTRRDSNKASVVKILVASMSCPMSTSNTNVAMTTAFPEVSVMELLKAWSLESFLMRFSSALWIVKKQNTIITNKTST